MLNQDNTMNSGTTTKGVVNCCHVLYSVPFSMATLTFDSAYSLGKRSEPIFSRTPLIGGGANPQSKREAPRKYTVREKNELRDASEGVCSLGCRTFRNESALWQGRTGYFLGQAPGPSRGARTLCQKTDLQNKDSAQWTVLPCLKCLACDIASHRGASSVPTNAWIICAFNRRVPKFRCLRAHQRLSAVLTARVP